MPAEKPDITVSSLLMSLVATTLDRFQGSAALKRFFENHTGYLVNQRVQSWLVEVECRELLYRLHPLTVFSSVLGLPTRNFMWDSGEGSFLSYAENFFRNIFRWHHPSAPLWQRIINYTLLPSLLAFGWHLLKALPNLLLAGTKLIVSLAFLLVSVTALLVGILGFIIAGELGLIALETNKPLILIITIPFIIIGAVLAIAGILSLVALGAAGYVFQVVISPYNSFMHHWEQGGAYKAVAILDLIIVAAVYALLAVYGLPALAAGLGVLMASVALPALITAGVNIVLTVIASLTASTALLASLGAAVGFVGTMAYFIADKASDWYYSLGLGGYVEKNLDYEASQGLLELSPTVKPNAQPHMFQPSQ